MNYKPIKPFVILCLLMCMVNAKAEITDAFKDIWPVTDKAMMRSLNGKWALKVVKGIGSDTSVPEVDASWGEIPVPGCWEAYGFCEAKYDYPDSLTGYYRTEFTVPKEWKGQHVVIRLDGVLRGYDLWLNGKQVGTWESAYNTCLFDLTPYLTKKAFKGEPQRLSMRVYSRFKGYEFDCFDDWAAMGIFRDVTLMAVPKTHLSDLTVTTKVSGEVNVQTKVVNSTRNTTVDYEILDADGNVVSRNGKVDNPHLWTAETPYLYTLRVHVKEKGKTLQTFTQKIGIRELSIDGTVLKLNGQPIKLRGVNAHATDPRTVKVIGDTLTLKDMHMMKEASVNYMRLSHYPREPRFYELADSMGFYLIDEVPFGFGDKHLSNRSYQDILMTRAKATVERDKNHPSVIVWSVGNENPLPQTCVEVGNYVGSLDASRPYCFPQVGSYFRRFWENKKDSTQHPFPSKAPVYAPHYPTTGQIGGFYQHLDRPVIFTEYCHTLGISFEDHDRQWEIIERTPGIAGGSVWEWADQGMPFSLTPQPSILNFQPSTFNLQPSTPQPSTPQPSTPQPSTPKYGYEERVFTSEDGGFEMYGNKGTDGLVYADRTPLPNYYELKHNYARALVTSVNNDSITIVNRFDFLDIKDNVTIDWTLNNYAECDTMLSGSLSPQCAPHDSVRVALPLPKLSGLALLKFRLTDKEGNTFLEQSFVMNKPRFADVGTKGVNTDVPSFLTRVGRKATMAERIKVGDKRIERYLQPLDNPYVKTDIKTVKCTDGSLRVDYTLTPDSTADHFLSEVGVAWLLPAEIDRVQWMGMGPFASYPGRYKANNYNVWNMHKDDLYFEGNRMGIDAAYLSDKDGNGIVVVGDSMNMNFEQTDQGIVLTVNAAVSGQGPKFSRTAFPVTSKNTGIKKGSFRICVVKGNTLPPALGNIFNDPQDVNAPFRPYLTQYDIYLMKYDDINANY